MPYGYYGGYDNFTSSSPWAPTVTPRKTALEMLEEYMAGRTGAPNAPSEEERKAMRKAAMAQSLVAIGLGISRGDVAGGFAGASDAMSSTMEERMEKWRMEQERAKEDEFEKVRLSMQEEDLRETMEKRKRDEEDRELERTEREETERRQRELLEKVKTDPVFARSISEDARAMAPYLSPGVVDSMAGNAAQGVARPPETRTYKVDHPTLGPGVMEYDPLTRSMRFVPGGLGVPAPKPSKAPPVDKTQPDAFNKAVEEEAPRSIAKWDAIWKSALTPPDNNGLPSLDGKPLQAAKSIPIEMVIGLTEGEGASVKFQPTTEGDIQNGILTTESGEQLQVVDGRVDISRATRAHEDFIKADIRQRVSLGAGYGIRPVDAATVGDADANATTKALGVSPLKINTVGAPRPATGEGGQPTRQGSPAEYDAAHREAQRKAAMAVQAASVTDPDEREELLAEEYAKILLLELGKRGLNSGAIPRGVMANRSVLRF